MKKIVKVAVICFSLLIFASGIYATYRATTLGIQNIISFDLNVVASGSAGPTIYEANIPELAEGMIPVKWNSTASNWCIAAITDLDWYDYNTQKWANVMLSDGRYKVSGINIVDSENSNAIVSVDGTQVVDESDLGSMYVWIPRYEYSITYYTDDTKTTISPTNVGFGRISVRFTPIGSNAVPNYTVHPAFKNGAQNGFENGEWDSELNGLWVAKFEASNSANVNNSTSGYIRTVPNVKSWSIFASNGVSSAYDWCKEMNSSSNASYYGISDNDDILSPHMMKNSEWGAVAYLAYSEFGMYGAGQTKLHVNNYFAGSANARYTNTGFGNAVQNTASSVTIINDSNKYNGTNGVKASTTGNVTGIYDMNGGLNEQVAAYLTGMSGFNGTNYKIEGGTKYCTIYDGNAFSTYGKLGDATREVGQWEGCVLTAMSSTNFSPMRGGAVTNGADGGLFSTYASNGAVSVWRGFRVVIAVTATY